MPSSGLLCAEGVDAQVLRCPGGSPCTCQWRVIIREVCAHLTGSSSFRGHPTSTMQSPRSKMLQDVEQRPQTLNGMVSFSFLYDFSKNDLSNPWTSWIENGASSEITNIVRGPNEQTTLDNKVVVAGFQLWSLDPQGSSVMYKEKLLKPHFIRGDLEMLQDTLVSGSLVIRGIFRLKSTHGP